MVSLACLETLLEPLWFWLVGSYRRKVRGWYVLSVVNCEKGDLVVAWVRGEVLGEEECVLVLLRWSGAYRLLGCECCVSRSWEICEQTLAAPASSIVIVLGIVVAVVLMLQGRSSREVFL